MRKNIVIFVSTLIIGISIIFTQNVMAGNAVSSNETFITKAINEGNVVRSYELLNTEVESATGIEKAKAIISLLTFDLLQGQTIFIQDFNKYWSDLNSELKKTDSTKDPALFNYLSDYFIAFYGFSISGTQEKDALKKYLSSEQNAVLGANGELSSVYKSLAKARAAAVYGDYSMADIHLNRARILLLNQDLKRIDVQIALNVLVDTSLYRMNDTKDVKYLKQLFQSYYKNNEQIIRHFNPLSMLLLFKNFYDVPGEDVKSNEIYAKTIIEFTKNLKHSKNSRFQENSDDTEANQILKDIVNNTDIYSIDSSAEWLNSRQPENLTALGVRYFYESSLNKNPDFSGIEKYLENVNKVRELRGDSPLLREAETSAAVLKSLRARNLKDKIAELKYLQEYVIKRRAFLTSRKISPGQRIAITNSINLNVDLYVIKRLSTLEAEPDQISDLALMSVLQMNANTKGEELFSDFYIKSADTDMNKKQVEQFLSISGSYDLLMGKAYRKALDDLQSKNSSNQNKSYANNLYLHSQYLDAFRFSKIQTINNRNKEYNYYADTKDLRKNITRNEIQYLFGVVNDFGVLITVSEQSSEVRLIAPEKLALMRNLHPKIVSISTAEAMRIKYIKDFSSELFGVHYRSFAVVQFLTGPTILGVPVTILMNPATNKYIIENSSVNSYLSPLDITLNNFSLSKNSRKGFLGIGNPILRSSTEIAATRQTELLIRGSNSTKINELPELPETEIELTTFLNTFDGNGLLLVGKDATRANLFKENLSKYEILSIATHGVMSGEVDGAMAPSLVMSSDSNDKGLLSTNDILFLNGAPNILLLSACNTGKSDQYLNDTNITSIASAFYMKGVSAIISSYWAVDSLATKNFMEILAHNIKKNMDLKLSTIFTKAIREMKLNPKFSDPIYWGAFSLVGDYQFEKGNSEPENKSLRLATYFDSGWYQDSFYALGSTPDNKVVLLNSTNQKISDQNINIGDTGFVANQGYILDENLSSLMFSNENQIGIVNGNIYSGYKLSCNLQKVSNLKRVLAAIKHSNKRIYFVGLMQNNQIMIGSFSPESCIGENNILNLPTESDLSKVLLLENGDDIEIGFGYINATEKLSPNYNGGFNELNLLVTCKTRDYVQFTKFDSAKLAPIRTNFMRDALIPLTKTVNKNGLLHLLRREPCTNQIFPFKVSIEQLSNPEVKMPPPVEALKSLNQSEAAIARNFQQLIYWDDSSDRIVASGTPLNVFFAKINIDALNNKVNDNTLGSYALYEIPSKLDVINRKKEIVESCPLFLNISQNKGRTASVCWDGGSGKNTSIQINIF